MMTRLQTFFEGGTSSLILEIIFSIFKGVWSIGYEAFENMDRAVHVSYAH